jgi:hypothetical protein
MTGNDSSTPSSATSETSVPDSSKWNDYVAVLGIVEVGILALLIAWFYGTANETSAAGLLNTVVPVIGTIVGLVFGVTTGSKAGSAAGRQAGAVKAQVARRALSMNLSGLKDLQTDVRAHKSRVAEHAPLVSKTLQTAAFPENVLFDISPAPLDQTHERIARLVQQTETALKLIAD